MRKTYNNLFSSIFTKENLYLAYEDAKKGKRKKREVFEFGVNLVANIEDLHNRIHTDSYFPDPYYIFTVSEPKPREIYAPSFRDIVVQHAIYRIIYSIFNSTFISTSFACRKGYGTHKCTDKAQRYMRACDGEEYYHQLDIRKFFSNIDRDILRVLIEKKIKDMRLVDIMMMFTGKDKGIPIGNLLSQLYALIYLNSLDHFVKENLRIKKYIRYVDDFVIFGVSRLQCKYYKDLIVNFLKDLKLELSKFNIKKIRKGINFVGYRTWKNKRFIRKYTLYKFFRAVRSGKRLTLASIIGHSFRTSSLRYMLYYLFRCYFSGDVKKILCFVFKRIASISYT